MNKKDYEFGDEIRLWSSFVPAEAGEEVSKILKSKWVNTGKQEKSFREKFAEKLNIRYCAATNSGTSSLRASLAALGVGLGDEVISTPYTFIATNTSVLEQGATPIFADIEYETLNINPASIEEKITPKTKAIICVHYGGNPCNMDAIREIGREHNLPIIEDSAHAIGSKYKGKYIGEIGDIIAFSLQSIKIITCGDGGMIATPHEHYYKEIKKRVWFGVDRDKKKTNPIDPLPDKIDVLGFKYNMNDIAATLGLVGLRHLDEALERRKKIGEHYRKEFVNLAKTRPLYYSSDNTPNYQIFPVHVKNKQKFAEHMRERSILVNVNNRRNDRYSIFGGMRNDLPQTALAEDDTILIPLHFDLTDSDVNRIVKAVNEYDRI